MKTEIVWPWLFVLSFALAALLALAMMGVLRALPAGIWQTWQPATCLGSGCFCEAIDLESPIRQSVNAWSSLAFVFSATWILMRLKFRVQGSRLPGLYMILIAAASLITGLGSAFYHASLTFTGQFFDILGMFLLAVFMLVYAWERLYRISKPVSLTIYGLLNLGLTILQVAIPETRRYVFAIVLVLALLFEYGYWFSRRPPLRLSWLNAGLGLFAAAYGLWILDNQRILCLENSLLQGHAAWHMLGAVAVVCLFYYYSSEALQPSGGDPAPARS